MSPRKLSQGDIEKHLSLYQTGVRGVGGQVKKGAENAFFQPFGLENRSKCDIFGVRKSWQTNPFIVRQTRLPSEKGLIGSLSFQSGNVFDKLL
jgi:hypothetical protein